MFSRHFCALFLSALMLVPLLTSDAMAVEPVIGTEYPGTTAIEISGLGLAFTIPAGWSGGIPEGSEVFILAKMGLEGQVIMAADTMDRAELQKRMSQAVPITEDASLVPAGPAKVEGNRVSNTYQITLFGTRYEGQAFGRASAHGVGFFAIGLYTEESAAEVKRALAHVESSLKLTAPVKPAPAPAASARGADSVAGRQLVRFIHGGAGGYNSKEQFFFCSDGTFARSYSGGGASMDGFSMGTASQGAGRYRQEGATIQLQWQDGTSGQLTMQRVDGQLMINGNKWFFDSQNRCP